MAAMEGLDSVSKTRRQVSFPSGIALETTSSIQMPKMPGINSIEDLQAFVSPDKPETVEKYASFAPLPQRRSRK